MILGEAYSSAVNLLGPIAGIAFKNMIYEGSGNLWKTAISQPVPDVDWIVMNPKNPSDKVAQGTDVNSPDFQATFNIVLTETDGLSLYHRGTIPSLPVRSLPADFGSERALCH
jgi:hypothetical protein